MAKKRIKHKSRKSNRKIRANSSYASLCALAPLIESKGIFDHIHQGVKIPQKKVDYPRVRRDPSDKLVFVVLGIMSELALTKVRVLQVNLNPSYPLINRIRTAFEALLKPYEINVSLDET